MTEEERRVLDEAEGQSEEETSDAPEGGEAEEGIEQEPEGKEGSETDQGDPEEAGDGGEGKQKEEGSEGEPSAAVRIGDEEYTPEQLAEKLEEAKKYKDLLPEYTRTTQELAKLKKPGDGPGAEAGGGEEGGDDPELASSRDRALKVLAPHIEEILEKVQAKKDSERALDGRLSELEKEIDGSDGRPKFVRAEIIKYAVDNNLSGDPQDIYEKKYRSELRDHYRKEGMKSTKKPVFTEGTPKGGHLPKGKDYAAMDTDQAKKAGVELLEALESNE